jgi:hypothetical protein
MVHQDLHHCRSSAPSSKIDDFVAHDLWLRLLPPLDTGQGRADPARRTRLRRPSRSRPPSPPQTLNCPAPTTFGRAARPARPEFVCNSLAHRHGAACNGKHKRIFPSIVRKPRRQRSSGSLSVFKDHRSIDQRLGSGVHASIIFRRFIVCEFTWWRPQTFTPGGSTQTRGRQPVRAGLLVTLGNCRYDLMLASSQASIQQCASQESTGVPVLPTRM